MEAPRAYDFKNLHYGGEGGVLIPLLQKFQVEDGYISRARIEEIHRKTGVPLAQIFGVATFYAQFRLNPVGRNIIKVCHGTACHVGEGRRDLQALEDHLRIRNGETTPDREFTLETVACLGCCSLAPVLMVNKETYGNLKPTDLRKVLKPTGEEGGRRVRILVGLGTCGMAAGAGATYAALRARAGTPDGLHGREDRLRGHVLPGAARRGPRGRRDALAVRPDDAPTRSTACSRSTSGRASRSRSGWCGRATARAPRRPSSTASSGSSSRNCGLIDPEKIEEYLEVGGYQALQKVLEREGPRRPHQPDHRVGAARARGSGLPHRDEVALHAAGAGQAEVRDLQRGRGRPRRLHGPLGPRERPALGHRGDGHRRLRDRRRRRATSTCAPSTRRPSSG